MRGVERPEIEQRLANKIGKTSDVKAVLVLSGHEQSRPEVR